jgi:hypothetical protein
MVNLLDSIIRGIPLALGSEIIVLLSPSFDDYLSLLKGIENLPVKQLIFELSIEESVVFILPGAAKIEEQRFSSDPPKPTSDRLSSKFGSII